MKSMNRLFVWTTLVGLVVSLAWVRTVVAKVDNSANARISKLSTDTASIGNWVWNDVDMDGVQDDSEPGLGGVKVDLYTCAGGYKGSTTTYANGEYGFNYLVPNDPYYVQFTAPDGYVFSPKDKGFDDVDSDADLTTGRTVCTSVAGGIFDGNWDAGLYAGTPPALASLGDRVWNDADKDGVQDVGEVGVPNVTVSLYACDESFVGQTSTDANGNYSFGGLASGDYYVQFTMPAGYVFSPQDQGGDDTTDSDANITTGRTICTTLVSGENDTTWDTGLYLPEPVQAPGTGTPGYWKNHPEAWPVNTITIGGMDYTKEQAIALIDKPDGDKTYTLFRALVSAKLNVLVGNVSSCVSGTIANADAWMASYGPAGSGVKASSTAWKIGEPLYQQLDSYNNGLLCAPHRD